MKLYKRTLEFTQSSCITRLYAAKKKNNKKMNFGKRNEYKNN